MTPTQRYDACLLQSKHAFAIQMTVVTAILRPSHVTERSPSPPNVLWHPHLLAVLSISGDKQ